MNARRPLTTMIGKLLNPVAKCCALLAMSWLLVSNITAKELVVAGMGVMPTPWDKEANFRLLERYARRAAAEGAHLVVTPEGFLDGYTSNSKLRPESTPEKYRAVGEQIDGPLLRRVAALAKELNIYLAVGFAERRGNEMFNTVAVYDPGGERILRYAKTHSPGETFTTKGTDFPVADTPFGRIGAMICYDRRLPEVARILAVKGARLLLVPAFGSDDQLESVTIMRIRAYENRAFVAFVNPTRVIMIDPRGNVLALHEGEEDELVMATFSMNRSGGGNIPHRVPDLYHELVDDILFTSRPFTDRNDFTKGIEGPACDAEGNVYAVNLRQQQTIGRVTPSGNKSVFVTLANDSTGNGIRFDRHGMMYVADYVGHNVLKIDPKTRAISVLAHEPRMNQPNDLAITADGTLFASDPNWSDGTGQLWRIDPDGTTTRLASGMGTTNGIEVSPDGKSLYVNESVQRNVWKFSIRSDGTLDEKHLLKRFDDFGFDGMRCDVDGNLYITRYGKGTVVKLSPEGEVIREIDVLGERPSNICFGGPDGRTAYVTEVQHQRLVMFRVDRPGLAWQRWQDAPHD